MQYWAFLFFGVVIALGILTVYLAHRAEVKRTEELRQVADDMGFEFHPAPGEGLLGRYPGFHLFSQGHSRRARNLLRGQAGGLEVAVFDYSYVTGSGKHRTTWRQTVVAFEIDGAELPTFALRPEGMFHKIGQWFGYHDIDFESHPGFSKSYLLRGQNEEAVRELFTDNVLEHYERVAGVCTEGSGHRLVYYRAQQRIKPDEARRVLEEGFEVLALFRPPEKGRPA